MWQHHWHNTQHTRTTAGRDNGGHPAQAGKEALLLHPLHGWLRSLHQELHARLHRVHLLLLPLRVLPLRHQVLRQEGQGLAQGSH
jgi:hypothetical protein